MFGKSKADLLGGQLMRQIQEELSTMLNFILTHAQNDENEVEVLILEKSIFGLLDSGASGTIASGTNWLWASSSIRSTN